MPDFDPANRLLIVADSPSSLRRCDVDRLAWDCGDNWPAMKAWLLTQSVSDLARAEIVEWAPE